MITTLGITVLNNEPTRLSRVFRKLPHRAFEVFHHEMPMDAVPNPGDINDEAVRVALRGVASHFETSEQDILEHFEVVITRATGCDGYIWARRK